MDSAAKTALLLDNTHLGKSTVRVTEALKVNDVAPRGDTDDQGNSIPQEEKPRSRIAAEYIAHGYALSDQVLQKAIELDKKHGVSDKFSTTLSNFNDKYKASEKAKALDDNYGISDKASTGWKSLHSYFDKALGTPSGQKVRDFYFQTDKQVRDIHEEAKRLAEIKAAQGDKSTAAAAGSSATTGSAVASPSAADATVEKKTE